MGNKWKSSKKKRKHMFRNAYNRPEVPDMTPKQSKKALAKWFKHASRKIYSS